MKDIKKIIRKLKKIRSSLEWWNSLPIQNLEDMSDSWVGYCHKYFPNKTDIYHLTNEEIQHIWGNEINNSLCY